MLSVALEQTLIVKMLMPLVIAGVIEEVGIHLSFLFLLIPAVGCASAFGWRHWGSVSNPIDTKIAL